MTVWGLFAALSAIVNAPKRLPLLSGVNVIEIVQLAPAVRLAPQLFDCAKFPDTAMLEIVSIALPTFVKFTAFGALVVPTFWFPKLRRVADMLTIGTGVGVTVAVGVTDPVELGVAVGVALLVGEAVAVIVAEGVGLGVALGLEPLIDDVVISWCRTFRVICWAAAFTSELAGPHGLILASPQSHSMVPNPNTVEPLADVYTVMSPYAVVPL
jgi:hypothetical protein